MASKDCPPLRALSTRLRTEARQGPAKFQAFLAGSEFHERFNSIPPQHRRRAIQAITEAEAIIHDGLPPPVKPQRIGDGRLRWSPAAIAKLAQAYARAKGDHEKAARIFRCSTGAARLAKRRYIDAVQPINMAA